MELTKPGKARHGSAPATVTLPGLLSLLPKKATQRQDGTDAQLETVKTVLEQHGGGDLEDWEKAIVANRLGAFDAADVFKTRAARAT